MFNFYGAAIIKECLSNKTFADDLDDNALDLSRTPAEVFAIAEKYIKTKLNICNLKSTCKNLGVIYQSFTTRFYFKWLVPVGKILVAQYW